MSWCKEDDEFGPFVKDTHSFTLCFASTVFELPASVFFLLFGFLGWVKYSKQPYVSPAKSVLFMMKLSLCIICFFCAFLLAVMGERSMANVTAQLSTGFAWLLCIIILISGYLRAQKQLFRLRLWYICQFASSFIVFINHSTLHPTVELHLIRGVSLFCVFLLVPISLYSDRDVPEYQDVSLHPASPSELRVGLMSAASNASNNSISTMASNGNIQAINSNNSKMLPSQLSQLTLYGAQTSNFSNAINAWNEASIHQKSILQLEQQEEEANLDDVEYLALEGNE